MTAVLPSAVDPLAGNTPQQQADTIATLTDAFLRDCATLDLRAHGISVDVADNLHTPAVGLRFADGDTAAVDALGDAYGFPPAGLHDVLYDRGGLAEANGRRVHVLLSCPRPETPAGGSPALAAPGGLPALTVESERVDGDQ